MVRYNITQNRYEWPSIRGIRPCPRAGAAVSVVDNYAYIFGGRCKERRLNDVFCVDLLTLTFIIADAGNEQDPFETPDPGIPPPRSLHSMANIGGFRIAVYGGLGQLCSPLNDCWILHVNASLVSWEEFDLPYDHGQVRCWHTGTLSSDGELLIHSGYTQEHYLTRLDLDDHCENILQLKFGVMSLKRCALDAFLKVAEKRHNAGFLKSLPKVLQEAVRNRLNLESVEHSQPSPKEILLMRDRLHAGI